MTYIYFIDPCIDISDETNFQLKPSTSTDNNVILLFLVSENLYGKLNMTKFYNKFYLNKKNLTIFPISLRSINSIKGIFNMLNALFICGIFHVFNNRIIFNTNFANHDFLDRSFINLARFKLVKLDHKIKSESFITTKLGIYVIASYIATFKVINNLKKIKLLFLRSLK